MIMQTQSDFRNEATQIFANSLSVEWRMIVRYVLKAMKYARESTNDSPSHVRLKATVSPWSERRKRTNISVQIDAENDTRRSIARTSFELKNLSR